ncbi:MAG TPA: sulfotransferase [Solirubrobacterales bacterium]|nr:sulfotransferase [Solirubrobacterales bacterium]
MVRLHAVIERASDAGLALATHTPILVIKEVNGSHAANRVMSLFPRSKMIFMLRDGRDVLDSLAAAYEPGAWLDAKLARNPLRQAEDRLAWMDETCRGWVADIDICMKAYDEHDPALRRMLRYEELLADTPTVLRDLLKWIGLPSNEPRIERIADSHSFASLPEHRKGPGRFRRSASPGKWREGLTPEEQLLALEIMGSRLVKLGYEGDSEPA